MKTVLITILLIGLSGCQHLGPTVTMEDGTVLSERAYMADKQYASEMACYNSRKIEMPDNPTPTQALAFAVASMSMQNAKPCSGTNSNDVDIAKTKARWGFARSLGRSALGAYGVGELADFGKTLANAKGDTTTFSTEITGLTQSNSSSGVAGSSDLGNGGEFSATESGIRSNSINIGGNSSVAGNRSAAGETALVNGDSSVISSVKDSDQKAVNIAEDINKPNDQSVFDDPDGGNGVSVDF